MTGKYAELNPHGPSLRTVRAHILTDLGWVQGTFLVPESQSLMDFFQGGVQLLKLTRARFPGEKELIPFIALRRETIHAVEPAAGEDRIEAPGAIGRTTPHEMSAFLLAGQLYGTLEVLVNVRLSDFVRQQTQLLILRDCVLVPYGEAKDSPKVRRMRVVLLNIARVMGFGEAVNPVSPLG